MLKDSEKLRFVKREHLDRTADFFEKHGGKTIVLARFLPIIRTFAPFVAGAGRMDYRYFITFNFVGGIVWVALFSLVGNFFGGLPIIRDKFSMVIIVMELISFIPVVIQVIKARKTDNLRDD
jgi:membrane-associated protein